MPDKPDELTEQWKEIVTTTKERQREMADLQFEMDMLKVRMYQAEQSVDIRSRIAKYDSKVIFLSPNYDPCIIGLTRIASPSGDWLPRLVYDAEKMMQVLIEDGMSLERAMSHVSMIQDACCHGRTPVFVLQV